MSRAILHALLFLPVVAVAHEAEEGDETCALQLRRQDDCKAGEVSCGGHCRLTCAQCPSGNGESWCHGECKWAGGACVEKNPTNCCKGLTADCLACQAKMTTEEYCKIAPQTVGCSETSGKACCMAMTAQCLACSNDMTEQEYCNQNPSAAGCPPQDPCTLCETCGGSWPVSGGRITYFRDESSTNFSAYSEHCGGQNRDRTGDSTVVFAPQLCCKESSGSLLEVEAQAEKAANEAALLEMSVEDRSVLNASSAPGWCRLCDYCGGAYKMKGGSISYLPKGSSWDTNSQNYVRYVDGCSSSSATKGAPPPADLCCRDLKAEPMCRVCQGSCGGQFPSDQGTMSYAAGKQMQFSGYDTECAGSDAERVGGPDRNSLPKLCCQR